MSEKDVQSRVVAAAIELIEKKGWSSEVAARLPSGVSCSYTDPDAACYCLSGSLAAACHQLGVAVSIGVEEINPIIKKKLGMDVNKWNDMPGRTKEDVLRVLREVRENLS